MSTTPATFTIAQTGTYRMTDGSAAYWFEAGTIIPMYLAIALGIEGAGYVDPPTFNTAQEAAINALIAASGGGGGGGAPTFPMAEGVWYSPFTILDGGVNRDMEQLTVDANTAQAAPVRIFEDCTISKIGLDPVTPPSGPVTFRLSLHRHSAARMVGEKVGDLGTIAIDDTFVSGTVSAAASLAVTAGDYWAVVTASAFADLASIAVSGAGGGYSGPMGYLDESSLELPRQIEITSTGIGSAIPADLSGATQGYDGYPPLILFQITHP